ncbi:MAG: hypothetical protein IJ069_10650 [Prevotella sp.]|nr:hypothetical protein [Prevotella sp.]MBQ8714594.1 hypothetical protein [Prevotella sp.]
MKMKRTVIVILMGLLMLPAFAQNEGKSFKGYFYNDEYEVFLRINFYDKNMKIPGQELYGELPGYLGRKRHSFCWVMVEAEIENEKKASMTMINDFGSEDLKASLTRKNDSIYIFKQEKGSTVKIPKNGKWQKLPKTLEFKKR